MTVSATRFPDPNTSKEAKDHAAAVLEGDVEPSSGGGTEEEQHHHRVIGGYKATLSSKSWGRARC